MRWRISPDFLAILVFFLAVGAGLFSGRTFAPVGVFLFVAAGWIISLCLHEGAHAYAAYWGGDKSVVEKGYLSLNPFAYAHPLMTFGLPLIYLLIGGIGLPGGAVYINHVVLKSRRWDAFVSLAGPLANLVFLAILSIPFLLDWPDEFGDPIFWKALSFLAALQASAAILNLLPIPGLDGFGIIRPYLPYDMQAQANRVASVVGFVLIWLFMSRDFSRAIWNATFKMTAAFGIEPVLIIQGARLFRLWS